MTSPEKPATKDVPATVRTPAGRAEDGSVGAPAQEMPLQLELPAGPPAAAPAAAAANKDVPARAIARAVVKRIVPAGVVVGVAGSAAAAVILPHWVRQKFIDAAAARGIDLSIDGAHLTPRGFRLTGLRATAADLPGAGATAPELDVETSGLQPTKLMVHGAQLALDGPWSRLDAVVSRWNAGAQTPARIQPAPFTLVVDDSRFTWQRPVGEGARLDASGVHLEVQWRGAASEVHALSEHVTLAVAGGVLGPWRLDVDRTASESRLRVALDPAVPEASTVLVVSDGGRVSQVDVALPRSPPARLGLPPALLGLRGVSLQLEATAHYTDLGPGHAELAAHGGVYGIEAPGLPRPLDVAWEAQASGDARAGLDFTKARLAAGPLAGALRGTLRSFDDGFRVDLAWSAGPVPCSAFEPHPDLEGGSPFDVAYALQNLAERIGITKLSGQVSASGSAAFDSRDLSMARFDFRPDVRCQLALFGK